MNYFSFSKRNSIIKIKVKGKNINKYLKRIIKDNINIIKYVPVSYNEAFLFLKYYDYLKLKKYKTIYKINIISKYGMLSFVELIKKNIYMILALLISIVLIYVLSNVIFSINVIHSSDKIRTLIYEELEERGIKKYAFKKDFEQIEKIEDDILKNNKDKLEWIEITENGCSYIIKVEERKINKEDSGEHHNNIISSKNAIISSINAISGEKLKKINDYVTKGDIIISGNITKSDGSIINGNAIGEVYGEVWYVIDIEYPYVYNEVKNTGKSKNVYVINFLGKRFSLFNFKEFHTFNATNKVILENRLLPISLVKEKQYETKITNNIYTEEEAVVKAIEVAKNKLKLGNKNIKEIIEVTVLEKNMYSSKVGLKLFFNVIENIGKSQKIESLDTTKN